MKQKLLVELNSLYSELQYEQDEETCKKIKKEIKTIEEKLEEGK